jgi:hypothetical protein
MEQNRDASFIPMMIFKESKHIKMGDTWETRGKMHHLCVVHIRSSSMNSNGATSWMECRLRGLLFYTFCRALREIFLFLELAF